MKTPTKRLIHDTKALQDKKTRSERNEFVIEGLKMVEEALQSFPDQVQYLLYSEAYMAERLSFWKGDCMRVGDKDMQRMTAFKQHSAVLAVMKKPEPKPFGDKIIVLDDLQDPGNFGTILRIADWFGITDVVASIPSVDAYNPKTVQASMGSILRTNVQHKDLSDFFAKNTLPVYGAVMDGTPLQKVDMKSSGVLLIGNESKGLSPYLSPMINHPITIERKGKAESLNAAIACGIICHHWT